MTTLTQTRHSIGASGEFAREENDFYATPPEATRALLEAETLDGIIWDPACGDGAICEVARNEYNRNVIFSDLHDRGYHFSAPKDFLAVTRTELNAWSELASVNIVTNPPFKLAAEFIEQALYLGVDKACFLLRLQFLEGQRRAPLLKKLARVHVFSKRIPRMHNPNWTGKKTTSLIAFAWFVYDRHYQGPTTLNWINPIRR